MSTMSLLAKSFPTLDCDAHVTETVDLWDHLSEKEREFVRQWYWHEGPDLVVNGNRATGGTWGSRYGEPDRRRERRRRPSGIEAAGPWVDKQVLRKLSSMDLTEEQLDCVEYAGARDPHARLKDMDAMGIDQVVAIPLLILNTYPWVASYDAAKLFARAYNDWIRQWCAVDPKRLYPAAALPIHYPPMPRPNSVEQLRWGSGSP